MSRTIDELAAEWVAQERRSQQQQQQAAPTRPTNEWTPEEWETENERRRRWKKDGTDTKQEAATTQRIEKLRQQGAMMARRGTPPVDWQDRTQQRRLEEMGPAAAAERWVEEEFSEDLAERRARQNEAAQVTGAAGGDTVQPAAPPRQPFERRQPAPFAYEGQDVVARAQEWEAERRGLAPRGDGPAAAAAPGGRRVSNPNARPTSGRSANDPDRMLERAARRSRGNPAMQAQIASMIRAPQQRAEDREWQLQDREQGREWQVEDRDTAAKRRVEERQEDAERRKQERQESRDWTVEDRTEAREDALTLTDPLEMPDGTVIHRTADGRPVHTTPAPRGPVGTTPIPGTDYVLPTQGETPVGGPLPVSRPEAPPEFALVQDPATGATIPTFGGRPVPPSQVFMQSGDGEWEPMFGPDGSGRAPTVRPITGPDGEPMLIQWVPPTPDKEGHWTTVTVRMGGPGGAAPEGAGSSEEAEFWGRVMGE